MNKGSHASKDDFSEALSITQTTSFLDAATVIKMPIMNVFLHVLGLINIFCCMPSANENCMPIANKKKKAEVLTLE